MSANLCVRTLPPPHKGDNCSLYTCYELKFHQELFEAMVPVYEKLDVIHLREDIFDGGHWHDYSDKSVIMLPWPKSHQHLLHF